MMGTKIRTFSPLPHDLSLEDLVPRGPLLPPPGGSARPLVREGAGGPALRERRQAVGGPGRLLQAPAGDVLRGHPLRAPTDGGGRGPPVLALVPRLRPLRALARPLQPHPHPRALRLARLPPLLREDRRGVRRGGAGVGRGALLRRHQGRGQRLHGEPHPQVLGRGPPGRALRGRGDARDRSGRRDLGAFRRGRTRRPARGLRSRASGEERKKGRTGSPGKASRTAPSCEAATGGGATTR